MKGLFFARLALLLSLAVTMFLLTACDTGDVTGTTNTPTPPPVQSVSEFEFRVFELTNEEREKHGLRPLIWDNGLAAVARAHSEDLARNNIFGHVGSDGYVVGARLARANIHPFGWAENVSGGRSTPEATVEGWMSSQNHRDNILSETQTHLGVGFAYLDNTRFRYYATQLFVIFPPR